jgi:hypothetical protein
MSRPARSSVRKVALFGRPISRPVSASISSIVNSPDSTASTSRSAPKMPIRLPMKPGVSFATTGPFPRRRSSHAARAPVTSGSVAVGINRRGTVRGGLKKWVTQPAALEGGRSSISQIVEWRTCSTTRS